MGRDREDLHASRTHDACRLGSSGRRAPEDASSLDRHTIDREIAARALPPVDSVRADLRDKAGVLRQGGDETLLERRLLDELKPILHEDPPQTDLVRD